jgi:hypothetical protein
MSCRVAAVARFLSWPALKFPVITEYSGLQMPLSVRNKKHWKKTENRFSSENRGKNLSVLFYASAGSKGSAVMPFKLQPRSSRVIA